MKRIAIFALSAREKVEFDELWLIARREDRLKEIARELNGCFLEFYPENNDALHWMHLVEEMHRARGGKWQQCPYRYTNPA